MKGRVARRSGSKSSSSAKLLAAAVGATAFAALAPSPVRAAELFWDADGTGTASGGSGTWDTTSPLWVTSGTNHTTWVEGSDANFPSVAPATVTLNGARTVGQLTFSVSATAQQYLLTGGSIAFNNGGPTTPSILMATNTSGTNSGQVILSSLSGGDIMIARNMNSNGTLLNLGGGGATGTAASTFTGKLILGGTGTGNTYSTSNKVSISSPGALPQGAGNSIEFRQDASQLLFTGGTAVGDANHAYTATFNNNINLNSSGTATHFNSDIGASAAGTDITLTGQITGDSDLTYGVGLSGGQGRVTLTNTTNNWTGQTRILAANNGVLRLGASNVLAKTLLNFGGTTGADGAVDLNGFDQTVSGLSSSTTGAITGIINTGGSLSTLTIDGNQITSYAGTIGVPVVTTTIAGTNNNIALHLASTNTGVLTFTSTATTGSTYSGGTVIDGGTLLTNNTAGIPTGTGSITVNNGGKLGGSGKVSGAVSSNSGGKIVPGGEGAVSNTFTLAGGATLAADSRMGFDFSSSANDQFTVNGGALTLPGSGTVKLDLADLGNGIHNQTYNLISYSAISGDPTTAIQVIAPNSGGAQNASFSILNTGSVIQLMVTGAANDLLWRGDGTGSGNWDVNTTSNFVLNGTATPSVYNNPDAVTFDDTANPGSGTTPITVTVAPSGVSPLSVTVNNNARNYTFTGGSIGGSGKLIKSGTGTLVLSSPNSYSGGTVVNAGTLAITSDSALGALPASPAVNVTLNKVGSTSSTVMRFDGDMTINANRQILITQSGGGGPTLTANGNVTIAGQILGGTAGGQNFVKAGTGTLTLLGDNSTNAGGGFINAMIVNAGTLAVSQDVSLGQLAKPVILNAGKLQLNGSFNLTGRALTISSGGGTVDTNSFSSTFDGVVSGSAALTKTGAGTLALSNTANTYSGNLAVNGGTLQLLSNLTTPASVTANGAIVQLAPGGGSNRVLKATSVAVTAGGQIDVSDNKLITATPVGTATGGTYDGVSGMIQSGRNGGSWNGSGIMTSQAAAPSGFTAVGVATAQQVKGLANPTDTALFAGQTVSGSDTVAMYTYGGDANLDGKINVDDYGHIDSNVVLPGVSGWFNGDFNYVGKINVVDYGIIDSNVPIQGAPFPTASGAGLNGVSAVPEPGSLGLIFAACGAATLKRRRAKKKDLA
jgi:fibronectin-binding autotransporter adhesin